MTALTAEALGRVRSRLIPFLFILFLVAYLDRVNISFAATEMSADLGFSLAAYGLGAGIFFIGYFIFEVPSNLILRRVGARVWIARIMLTWGLVSGMTAFVTTEWQFYLVRFLLGAAEAGFFPGVVLYLTYWVPRAERARTMALFLSATAVAGVVGAPISGALLSLDGVGGLQGWQWLFIVEAIPALVLAVIVWLRLPNGPQEARFLTEDQRLDLVATMQAEAAETPAAEGLGAAFRSGRVWVLSFLYLSMVIGFYGISLWLPLLVKREYPDLGTVELGFVTAIPYLCAVVAMIAVGRSSDRRRERTWHLALPLLAGSAGLLVAAYVGSLVGMLAICVATAGLYAALGPFWTLPPAFLRGAAAAAGIAWINSVGNLGGFIGPFTLGQLATEDGGVGTGLAVLAAITLVAVVASVAIARAVQRQARA